MQVKSTTDPSLFRDKVFPCYLKEEALNCVPIGVVNHLTDAENPRWKTFFLNWIEDAGEVIGAFTMTPPHPLILTSMPEEALDLVIATADTYASKPTAVLGANDMVDAFVAKWKHEVASTMEHGIFQCSEVVSPTKCDGEFRPAEPKDRDVLIDYAVRFSDEAGADKETAEEAAARTDRFICEGQYFVWTVGGEVVSMTAAQGETPRGIRIGYVFTPSSLRGRGYASNLVARVTQHVIDGGKDMCFLYTDLANPTSNKIYQGIGYERVGTSRHVDFVAQFNVR